MKMRYSNRKILLKHEVIDLANFEVRPKATDFDLERYYDEFTNHAPEIRDYFEEQNAFQTALDDISGRKRPLLIARDHNAPFLWTLRSSYSSAIFGDPKKRRLHPEHFVVAHCIVNIPHSKKGKEIEVADGQTTDYPIRQDITELFEKHPRYEGIIEVGNDDSQPATKATTFHESLHYLIMQYQARTGRRFVDTIASKFESDEDKRITEDIMHERAVEILTDKLLTHDSDAQFENRYQVHKLVTKKRYLIEAASIVPLGPLAIYLYQANPYLLPTLLIPGRLRDYYFLKEKEKLRESLLQQIDYPKFKI